MAIKKQEIMSDLLIFLKKGNPLIAEEKNLPNNKSLVELGLMDSFGVVEVVSYFEKKYGITIQDNEITKKLFGSINKMVNLVHLKIKKK